MEEVGFPTSGEIEQALIEWSEPLLSSITIKEEVPDEQPDPAAATSVGARPNVGIAGSGDAAQGGSGSGGGEAGAAVGSKSGESSAEGADSLAGPSGAGSLAALRCELCGAALAQQEGTPKLMECLHSICEPCLKAKIEEKQNACSPERVAVTCPSCRLQCQAGNMIDQRFVMETLAAEQAGTTGAASEQQCSSCEDVEPATSYCVDCAEFICDSCVNAHQRLKITKDHTIKGKEEAVAELQAAQGNRSDIFCADHPQERLSLFCETCDRLTCRDCQLQHHRDHKYQFSTEMAAQARASIASLLSEVSYKRVLLGSAMKVIRDRQLLIADKKKALVHEITQTVVKLTNAINTRGKQLVLRLNEVCDGKQRTLGEKKAALEQLAAITDYCVGFVGAALQRGSDTALLYCKRSVCQHLQRIKCRRADIPNPEIPVRISLALDNLADLVKVLSTIGAIVVDGKMDGGGSSLANGAGGAGGGGAGGAGQAAPAQGPYHPPAGGAGAGATPANSAVVALQHAAMQQSYVASRSGGASPVSYMSALQQQLRPRLPLAAPLQRHAQHQHQHHVTSTTHPHHQLHGMSELNLRALLVPAQPRAAPAAPQPPAAAPPARLAPLHHAQHAQHAQHAAMHAYQQMMGAYAANTYGGGAGAGAAGAGGAGAGGGGRRSCGPRTPSPAPPPPPPQYAHAAHAAHPAHPAQQHAAKWHIPQHNLGLANGGFELSMGGAGAGAGAGAAAGGGADFKITLGRLHAPGAGAAAAARGGALVTSTNPKTPSPSLNGGGAGAGGGVSGGGASGGGVSSELDKVCAASVQDLMATIAKLDSNGVQVLREQEAAPEPAPSPAPHVHSSTDADLATGKLSAVGGAAVGAGGAGVGGGVGADPNEDWCAVCMDGGELMCCDKCPKVFHQYCHIPTIEKLPDETETWQCLLCVNFAELPPEEEPGGGGAGAGGGLSARQQKIVERITLELYCQYELSVAFREPVPPGNAHYHAAVARPVSLDDIRARLQPPPHAPHAPRYTHVAQFVADCRLLFRNACHYNAPESQIYKDAKRLEEFFNAQLLKWLPEYAYWSGEGEPPAKRPRLD